MTPTSQRRSVYAGCSTVRPDNGYAVSHVVAVHTIATVAVGRLGCCVGTSVCAWSYGHSHGHLRGSAMGEHGAVDELGWDVHLRGLKEFDLIDSPWPIVHGSRECLDNTKLETPDSSNLEIWVSQNVGMDKPGIGGTYSPQELMDALLGKNDALLGEAGTGFSMADANPVSIITEKVSDAEQRLWTSGFKNVQVYRHRFGEPELELLARGNHGGFDFRYHGTYSLVASVNGSAPAYMMAIREQIYRFTLKGNDATGFTLEQSVSSSRDNTESEEEDDTITSVVEFGVLSDVRGRALPAAITGVGPVGAEYALGSGAAGEERSQDGGDDRNYIIGLSLTSDGTLIAATKGGNVTAYLLEPAKSQLQAVSYLPLAEHVKQKSIHISNSIAVHKQGIYIVTQEELVRVDLDPDTKKLSFGWTATYGPSAPWYTSRLGPGSGSTPTITSCHGREYAVITDGSTQMGLAYYDIETGEEVAKTKLDFGPAVNGTTSEQSVAVRGCQAFVVNNFIGVDGINEDSYCQYATGLAKQELATFCNTLQPEFISKVCPAVFGCTAYGVAMYSLETNEDDSLELQKLWSRDDLTCGTSIPLISDPPSPGTPSTTYCVGRKRGSLRWGILALDTKTGDDVFTFEYFSERRMTTPALRGLSSGRDLESLDRPKRSGLSNFFANPYYAGVEAVGGGSLAIGSIGGVIVVTPRDETVMTMTAAASSSSSSEIRSEVMGLLAGLLSVLFLSGGVFFLAVRMSHRRDWSPGGRRRIKSNGNEATYRLLSSPTR